MVRVLFKNLLHQDERYEIYFSKRWMRNPVHVDHSIRLMPTTLSG
jgi:hypothetical protein